MSNLPSSQKMARAGYEVLYRSQNRRCLFFEFEVFDDLSDLCLRNIDLVFHLRSVNFLRILDTVKLTLQL